MSIRRAILAALTALTLGWATPATTAPILVPVDATCVVKPTGLECTPATPPPPLTYQTTLALDGTGAATATGSVSPAGPQAPGTQRTLTVTPKPGDTVSGYRPSPCAPTFAQPTADLACLATVVAAVTPPPSGGPGAWQRLVQGQPFNSPTNPSPTNWYYNCFAVERIAPGRVWGHWANRTHLFDPAAGNTWKIVPNGIDWRENFGCTHDGTVFRLGPGAPVASGSNPPVWAGSVIYDAGPSTYALDPVSTGTGHSLYYYDAARSRILSFGGWSSNIPLTARPLPTGAPVQLTATRPTYSENGARETLRRSGVLTDGTVWFIGDGNALWLAAPPTYAWTTVATTGARPTTSNGVYAWHKGTNTIVGWIGCDSFGETCQGQPVVNQTYLLDLTTKVWRLGPGAAGLRVAPGLHAPAPKAPRSPELRYRANLMDRMPVRPTAPGVRAVPTLPPIAVMVVQQLLTDEVNDRVLWVGLDWETGGTSIFAWTPSAAPPPTGTVPLTTPTAGTGTGTLTGAGQYAPAAPVTLGATPAAGSTFAGWTPADPCGKISFPMPATPLVCTGTFLASAPIPPLSGFKFFGRPLPALTAGVSPPWAFSRDGNTKDVPCDVIPATKRILCGTGDFTGSGGSDSGRNEIFSYDPGTNQAELLSAYCHPPGQITPNHSSDKGPFWYRALDHALYVSTELPFPDQNGQPCTTGTPSGSTYTTGLLKLDLTTRVWSLVGGLFGTKNLGRYDPATDLLWYVRAHPDCGGGALWTYHVASKVSVQRADLCMIPDPPYSAAGGGFYRAQLAGYLQNFAWDPATQTAYIVLTHGWIDATGNTTHREAFLWEWSQATGTIRQLAKPPVSTFGAGGAADYSIAVTWAPGIGVLWPVIKDPCGRPEKMLVYVPADRVWKEAPLVGDVTQDIRGTSQVYLPGVGFFLAGSVFCAGPNQQYSFLWTP